MSKKHFIALADVIRDHQQNSDYPFTESAIDTLADFCASTNPAFNRSRWLGYIAGTCGPNGGAVKGGAK